MNLTNVGLNYNYNLDISRKWKLSPGLQVYYYTKNINYTRLIFSDQILRDQTLPVSIELERLLDVKQVKHLDVSSSLLAYSDRIWAGFTLDHMLSMNNSPKAEGGYLPMRLSLYGGGKILFSRMRSRKEESISGAFTNVPGQYKYLDSGAYYTWLHYSRLWYRGIPASPIIRISVH